MMKTLRPLFFLAGLFFSLISAAYCEDYTQTVQGSEAWNKALNTQKNVNRLSSAGQVPGYSGQKMLTAGEVFQSEHSANPLSRPGDGSSAIRQAEKAVNSGRAAVNSYPSE